MRNTLPILLLVFMLLSAACLGEDAKKAEMALDTKVAEMTGALETTEITASEFMDMYLGGEDFVLIDVRTDREFDSGYIPGAVHIPYTELDQRIGELNISKDQRIVVYCEAGVRSKKGANSLLQEGYTNIVDVTDGIEGWRTLGGDIIVPGVDVTPSTTAPPTTTAPSTTSLPTVAPSTTAPPTTAPPETTPPATTWPQPTPTPDISYLSVEPTLTLEGFDGIKTFNIDIGESIKIDDAYIYLTGDFDGCVGWVWWYFNIYRDTPEGAVWEGTPPLYLNEEVHAFQDISEDIHRVSDALDDYMIVVTKWSEQEGLTVDITH
jgi:rhodanese-related sulfurtransferase